MTDAPPTPAPAAAAERDQPWVPFWLVRLGALGWRLLVVLALGLVLLWVAWTLGTVTASVALALVISAAFAPFVIRQRERGWAPTKAAAVATLVAVAILGVVLAIAAGVLVRYGADLVAAVRSGMDALESEASDLSIPPEVLDAIRRLVESVRSWVGSNAIELAGTMATVFTVVLFGTFTTFFLLKDGDRAWAWGMQAASERRRAAATASGRRGLGQVGGYLRTVTALAAVEAIVDGVLMFLFGVPLALPLATLVFVGGFIPYIGGLVATAVVFLAALAAIGPPMALVLLGLIVVADILEDRYIGRVARIDAVRVHPAVLLLALPVGAVTGGLFGVILAGPVAAFVLATGGSLLDAIRPDPAEEAESDGPDVVPDWLDVLAQWSWRLLVGFALVGIGVLAVVQVPAILLPLVIAAVLASTFAPLTQSLIRRGWSASFSAAAVTSGAYLGIAAIVAVTIASLARNASDVADQASGGASLIDDLLSGFGGSLEDLVAAIGSGLVGSVSTVLAEVFALTLAVILGAILTFFFLRDGATAWQAVSGWMAPWRRREADAAAGRAVGVLGGYMVGTGVISAFGAVTQLVIMVVLGIPLAVPLAVLSFFGGFIPYIGSLVTTGLAFLVTVAYGSTTDIAVMGVFTIVFNIVQGNIVAPLVYGKAVHIHPAIVLLAIPAGSAVAGVLGMFLVVPFIGVVATTWRTVLVVMGEEHQRAGPPTAEPRDLQGRPTTEDEPVPRLATGPGDGAIDG